MNRMTRLTPAQTRRLVRNRAFYFTTAVAADRRAEDNRREAEVAREHLVRIDRELHGPGSVA